eukprot:6133413-Pleurochrysis_carterae.AAC.1
MSPLPAASLSVRCAAAEWLLCPMRPRAPGRLACLWLEDASEQFQAVTMGSRPRLRGYLPKVLRRFSGRLQDVLTFSLNTLHDSWLMPFHF